MLLCSALPETLDPASYANLLPCRWGDVDADKLFAEAARAAAAAAATTDQGSYSCPRTPETVAPFPRLSLVGGAAAAEQQQDPRVLAAWYAGRARELDARAGQLRHAATMCQLGVSRVIAAGGHEEGGAAGADAAVEDLVQLDLLLQHLASLVSGQTRSCFFFFSPFVS